MPFGAAIPMIKAAKRKRIRNRFEHMPECLGIIAAGVELYMQLHVPIIDIPCSVFWSILPPSFAPVSWRSGEF